MLINGYTLQRHAVIAVPIHVSSPRYKRWSLRSIAKLSLPIFKKPLLKFTKWSVGFMSNQRSAPGAIAKINA